MSTASFEGPSANRGGNGNDIRSAAVAEEAVVLFDCANFQVLLITIINLSQEAVTKEAAIITAGAAKQ